MISRRNCRVRKAKDIGACGAEVDVWKWDGRDDSWTEDMHDGKRRDLYLSPNVMQLI